jgi:hypothetical protein
MKISVAVLIGALIALGGISIILNAVFKVDLPIFRLALGIFFLYLGVVFVVGTWSPQRREWAGWGEQNRLVPRTASGQDLKYDVIFGRGVVDLTQLELGKEPQRVEINVVFADAEVKLDPAMPYELEATSVFGAARMPDQSTAAFSSLRYLPREQREPAVLRIKLNVVFGNATVMEVGPAAQPRASAGPRLHQEAPAAPH